MTPSFQLHQCPIFLGTLEHSFSAWLHKQAYSQLFIIADSNTKKHCLPVFLEKTGLSGEPTLCVIEAGEQHKNLTTCAQIWQDMLMAGLDRKALVINLGGGVIGDMGGFCAATWKRGIDFVQVPSSLLSMTDAAIGGKLGVDFQGLKNIIGVFQQPAAVFIDPDFLKTLPARELLSGYAEIIKHAQISRDFEIPGQLPNSENSSSEQWLQLLQASVAVKVRIVTEDPYEKGIRMLLNFGHTIGHAIESYFMDKQAPLTHGEAIAIGMLCEQLEAPGHEALTTLILNLFPHRQIPEFDFPIIWALMQQDKKNKSGKVRMALPDLLPYSLKVVEPNELDIRCRLLFYNALGEDTELH